MKKLKVGLQLYSIRQALTEDMEGALGAVKAMGYDYVEFSGGRYGRTARETRQLLDQKGLTCVSVHQSPSFFENDPVDAVEYVKTLGAKFAVIPVCRLPAYLEDREKQFRLFREMTQAFHRAGIDLLYHNHDHELTVLPGDEIPLLDRIFREVEGLKPEFDTCWLSYGGADPVSYLQRYAQSRKSGARWASGMCRWAWAWKTGSGSWLPQRLPEQNMRWWSRTRARNGILWRLRR